MALSEITRAVFWAGDNAALTLLPTFLLIFAGETLVFYLLYRNPERRKRARRISMFTTLACVLMAIFFTVAVAVPLIRLAEQVA